MNMIVSGCSINNYLGLNHMSYGSSSPNSPVVHPMFPATPMYRNPYVYPNGYNVMNTTPIGWNPRYLPPNAMQNIQRPFVRTPSSYMSTPTTPSSPQPGTASYANPQVTLRLFF